MKLATLRTPHGTRAVRVDDGGYVDLGLPDVGHARKPARYLADQARLATEVTTCGTPTASRMPWRKTCSAAAIPGWRRMCSTPPVRVPWCRTQARQER